MANIKKVNSKLSNVFRDVFKVNETITVLTNEGIKKGYTKSTQKKSYFSHSVQYEIYENEEFLEK